MSEPTWTVRVVTQPNELVAASDLFDGPVSPAGAQDFLARPGHLAVIAYALTGEPVGFVTGVEMRHPDKEPELFVYELGVDKPWRRRGVAAAMLAALRDLAADRGCTGLWTVTEDDNVAALATYRALGADIDESVVVVTWDRIETLRSAHG